VRFGTTQSSNHLLYSRPASLSSALSLTTALKNGATDSVFVNGALVLNEENKFATIVGCEDTGYLGRGYQGTAFDGDIAELLIYQRALTSSEREAVEDYLIHKYDLTTPAPPLPKPTLYISPAGAYIVVSWSSPCPSCILEESSDLMSSTGWSPVPASGALLESTNSITLPMTESNRFLRLRVK
jgi:hypothetical protein